MEPFLDTLYVISCCRCLNGIAPLSREVLSRKNTVTHVALCKMLVGGRRCCGASTSFSCCLSVLANRNDQKNKGKKKNDSCPACSRADESPKDAEGPEVESAVYPCHVDP